MPAVALLLALADAALLTAWLQRDDAAAPPSTGEVRTPAVRESGAAGPANLPARAAETPAVDLAAAVPASTDARRRAVVFGTVTRADGSKPGRGWIVLERGDLRATAGLQGDNGYALAGIEPGTWELRATFPDDLPATASIAVHAPRTRVDVVLPAAARLPVYAVTPTGEALLDAMVKLDPSTRGCGPTDVLVFREPLQRDLPLSNHREPGGGIGVFRIAIGWPGGVGKAEALGVLTLPRGAVAHAALLLRGALIAQQPVPANAQDLTFTVDPEAVFARMTTVRARIVDETGAPQKDGRLLFNGGFTITGGVPVDADGRATCRVPPGLHEVDVLPHFVRLGRLAAEPGATIDLGDLVVPRSTGGRNVDLTTEPRMDASFTLTDLEPPPGTNWRPNVTEGRATNGGAWIRIAARRQSLFVASKTHAAMIEIDERRLPRLDHTTAMDGFPLTVQLQPAPALRIQWRTGDGRTNVLIRAENGGIVLDRDFAGTGSRELRLPPGPYEVILTGMRTTTTQRLVVGTDDTTLVVE